MTEQKRKPTGSGRKNQAPKGKGPEKPAPKGKSTGKPTFKGKSTGKFEKPYEKRRPGPRSGKPSKDRKDKSSSELIRLNKYIANAGVCSRREADKLIAAGTVMVNGKIVTDMGVKVSPSDKVQYGGETLRRENLVYVLLNKPKAYITTVDDPHERQTVMLLVRNAARERIYPVGRLDRNTTGVLLFTNDGELAKKLTHPSHRIEKVYHVVLDRNLTKKDMETIAAGIELDDGPIKVDEISYIKGNTDKKEIGIRLHSGRNRIIRRIFEAVDYKVTRLDRVIFAGLTKKDIPRGKWRHLNRKEIEWLKMLKK